MYQTPNIVCQAIARFRRVIFVEPANPEKKSISESNDANNRPARLKSGRAAHSDMGTLPEFNDLLSKAPAEMPLLPLDRQTSLGELAYVSLKEAIVRGEFSAGQKLRCGQLLKL